MEFEIISEKELIKAYKDKRPKGKWLRHQAGLFDYHCYSEQNGYYTTDIDIYYAKKITRLTCEERFD